MTGPRWRRLTEWHEAGVWQRSHERLLAELRTGLLDVSAVLVDSTHLRAAVRVGSTPTEATTG